ncbi:hypothetical protein EMIT0210MI2_11991 [Priestia megaterium]
MRQIVELTLYQYSIFLSLPYACIPYHLVNHNIIMKIKKRIRTFTQP